MAELREVLERLSNEFGPSGRERSVRALVRKEIEGLVDRIEVDALGNLITVKAGTGAEPRLRVMVSAHMDEIGFMVTKIEKEGLLRFDKVGGVDPRTVLGKRVVIGDQRLPGVIGAPPPHLQSREEAERVLQISDLYIDIGAGSDKAADGKVKVGDYATFATRFALLSDDGEWPTARGKAFDDRAGCAVLIGLLAERYPVDLCAVFTVQEEVGLRGAHVAAYRVAPDAAFALEGTVCDDIPRPPDDDVAVHTRLGAGPAITLMDRSVVAYPGLVRLLERSAEAEEIPFQYKTPGTSSTDSGAIHLARGGVPTAVVSIPCRYIHSPASILNLNDLQNSIRLVAAALQRIERVDLTRQS